MLEAALQVLSYPSLPFSSFFLAFTRVKTGHNPVFFSSLTSVQCLFVIFSIRRTVVYLMKLMKIGSHLKNYCSSSNLLIPRDILLKKRRQINHSSLTLFPIQGIGALAISFNQTKDTPLLSPYNVIVPPTPLPFSFSSRLPPCLVFSVDVDKFDYISRDCFMVGIKSSHDPRRLMLNCRVINGEVCFHAKEVYSLYELFHTRYRYRSIYTFMYKSS